MTEGAPHRPERAQRVFGEDLARLARGKRLAFRLRHRLELADLRVPLVRLAQVEPEVDWAERVDRNDLVVDDPVPRGPGQHDQERRGGEHGERCNARACGMQQRPKEWRPKWTIVC